MCPIVNVDLGRTDELDALDAALDALHQLRANLGRIYGERRVGQCREHGNWGRCKAAVDHSGDHDFPTEAEGLASIERHQESMQRRRELRSA